MTPPDVPAGYAVEIAGGATVIARTAAMQTVLSCIESHGTLHAAAAAAGGPAFAGRGTAYRFQLPDDAWVVRRYHRGGLVARVLDDEYFRVGTPRPLRELRASVAARERGVDTPEVMAAIIYPAGMFHRADIATHCIDDSRDLADIALGDDRPDAVERVAVWRAAGSLLRSAFAAGVVHADLNLRNILIAGPRAVLLDLDRARVQQHGVSGAQRRAMLERLHRSRRKLEAAAGRNVDTAELAAFDAALEGRT